MFSTIYGHGNSPVHVTLIINVNFVSRMTWMFNKKFYFNLPSGV